MRFAEGLVIILMISLTCTTVSARTWHVPDDAPTIKAGIDSAAAGDTVMVECGTYYENNMNVLTSGIYLTSETGNPDCVTIDAGHSRRVIRFSGVDSTTVMKGFTLTNGQADDGGGMYINESQLKLLNCIITGNYGGAKGGGINLNHSDVTITNCLFEDNATGNNGGALASHSSEPIIRNCTFVGNSARLGGHMYLGGGTIYPILEYNVFAFADTGGMMYCNATTPQLDYFIVYDNAGGDTLCGVFSNFLNADPLFCYTENPVQPYAVHANSPCLPSNNPWGVHIGVFESGCPSPAEPVSWGSIKRLFD